MDITNWPIINIDVRKLVMHIIRKHPNIHVLTKSMIREELSKYLATDFSKDKYKDLINPIIIESFDSVYQEKLVIVDIRQLENRLKVSSL